IFILNNKTDIESNVCYSDLLAHIFDPPHLLYVKGSLIPEDAKAVAIVGSRQCTSYGRRTAERLATGLAHKGYTVISGLARGIDGATHRAALKAGGRTLAGLRSEERRGGEVVGARGRCG